MKNIIFIIIGELISITSILVAGYLAFNSIKGWGWFLVIAILNLSSYNIKSEKKDEGKDEKTS